MLAASRRLLRGSGLLGSAPLSTVAAKAAPVEEVTFLRLNNLQDNPGAVKKVSLLLVCYDDWMLFVLIVTSKYI